MVKVAVVVGLCLLCVACAGRGAKLPPLETVPHVDLSRYTGVWYEVARYPNRFQEGCTGSNATYTLRPDGDIDVLNRCRDRDGSVRQAQGRAWVVDSATNSRLKVSFFWPFRGDYQIMVLGPAYDYVLIGTPDRKYLWILSRTPKLDEQVIRQLLAEAQRQGFDPGKVMRTGPEG